jgi:hypothetical protein
MTTLDDFFYGNITPIDKQIFKKDLQQKIYDIELEIHELLDVKGKKLLDSFVDSYCNYNCETAAENFKCGFKLACKLIIEGLN